MNEQEKISFPQYRRYLNGKSYFCFESADSFEEIRQLGSRWLVEKYEVKILPDRNLVYDLLYDFQAFAEPISAAEYAGQKSLANQK